MKKCGKTQGMNEPIKLSKGAVYQALDDATEVNSSYWRHGRRVTYLIRVDNVPYIFDLDVHTDEGPKIYGEVTAYPAKQEMRPVWVRA